MRVAPMKRFLENVLIACRNRLLNLAGECAFALAMLPQEQVYEILDQAVRDKLEELTDPKNAAADAVAAGLGDGMFDAPGEKAPVADDGEAGIDDGENL